MLELGDKIKLKILHSEDLHDGFEFDSIHEVIGFHNIYDEVFPVVWCPDGSAVWMYDFQYEKVKES